MLCLLLFLLLLLLTELLPGVKRREKGNGGPLCKERDALPGRLLGFWFLGF